jgi:hypothetical protein
MKFQPKPEYLLRTDPLGHGRASDLARSDVEIQERMTLMVR